MTRRVLLLVTASLLPLLSGCWALGPAERPNVVVILVDDLRHDALSCAGHPFLKTPHLDRLAAEGVRFNNAFCTTSLCSPSRASLLTGLYARGHKVLDNFTDLPADLPNAPKLLQAAGWETGYIGKWHMGEDDDAPRPGFDFWMSHKGQGKYFDTEFNIDGRREVVPGYYTRVVTDAATNWIRRRGDKPFFLILGHKAPHSPNQPEERHAHAFDEQKIEYPPSAFALEGKPKWIAERITTWHGIYGPLWGHREKHPDTSPESVKHFADFVRNYYATVLSVDDSVGRVYEQLKNSGKLDNTVFVFVGDNGFFLGEHGMMDKRAMHEASIRVPMIVRYPKIEKSAGRVSGELVLNVDLAPSILDLCGVNHPGKMHGASWKPLLAGDAGGWRTTFLYEYNYERQFPYTPNVRGVRTEEWKLIRYPHGDGKADRHKSELYHLRSDPGELRNLIDSPQHAARRKELEAELARLSKAAGPDKMPLDEGIKTTLPDTKIR